MKTKMRFKYFTKSSTGIVKIWCLVLLMIAPPLSAYGVVDLTDNVTPVVYVPSVSDQPDVAVDSQGNIHVVWSDDCDAGDEGYMDIYYKMLDPDLAVLIDNTMITNNLDDHNSMRPIIAIDSQDRVFVVRHDDCYSDGCDAGVFLCRLEPFLDDRNGDPADPLVIKTLPDLMVSSDIINEKETPRLVIDGSDNLHIVCVDKGLDDINYQKLSEDGTELVAEKPLGSPHNSMQHPVPDLALDGSGNVHISWSDESITSYEIIYAMLDNDGTTLIAPTQMTDDDGYYSMRQSIDVDSDSKVYIVWHDERAGNIETYFMQLDPSLDDQNGSAAIPSVIKTVGDTALTLNDDEKSQLPFSRVSPNGLIHVTYHEADDEMLYYLTVDSNGNLVGDEGRLSESPFTYTQWTNAHIAFSGTNALIVWADVQNGYPQIFMFSKGRCTLDVDCDDEAFCNGVETCEDGICQPGSGSELCPDDGLYCNGEESCDEENDRCTHTGNPCNPGQSCNEKQLCYTPDPWDQCYSDYDCESGLYCTIDSCVDGECVATKRECEDDGLYCNGEESCDEENNACIHSGDPCALDFICDEDEDICIGCVDDADCDDEVFCNGAETCEDGICQKGSDPCLPGEACDEENDRCLKKPAPPLSFSLIPNRALRSRLSILPHFMFIMSDDEDTEFDRTATTVTFSSDVLTPPLTMVLNKNLVFTISLIKPTGMGVTEESEAEVTVTTDEGEGTQVLTLKMLSSILGK